MVWLTVAVWGWKWALKRLMLIARVYLDDGFMFGAEGEVRANQHRVPALLADALQRIEKAVRGSSLGEYLKPADRAPRPMRGGA
jgi:bifunctional pyridoxal-dependent enzyme with beta-cystathionase and maltose regulon repressor activities